MLVVIDTNILVSSLWSKNGAPAQVMGMVFNGKLVPCYDYRIMNEYRVVLERPKFQFSQAEINSLLEWIETSGRSMVAEISAEPFVDEADRKFYEVAKSCHAVLITGNKKHFPKKDWIVSVSEFLEQYQTER